ncbi:uncharacterized protein LOC134441117 [Engraulis encrasicolus]|uniref:uncharacterized protein LOC134441117 n=1 Tax=Engraulis encrasicolus TaxID=184585 RepID=UPI002FD183BC
MTYVTQDVKVLMDTVKDKQKLTKDVLSTLQKTYERYDWTVVVFKTKSSNQKSIFKVFKSHTLTGFTAMEKDDITVAVARQVKGKQANAAVVKKAMETCFPQSVQCHKVGEHLEKCKEDSSKVFTAVHAYRKKPHYESTSENEQEVEEDAIALPDTSPQSSYIQIGDCQNVIAKVARKNPKFVVMAKSQDEISGTDPCSKLKCGAGKCVRIDSVVALCECDFTWDGKTCENLDAAIDILFKVSEKKKGTPAQIQQGKVPAIAN